MHFTQSSSSRPRHLRSNDARRPLQFEQLETRQLLASVGPLSNGILPIVDTIGTRDEILIEVRGGWQLLVHHRTPDLPDKTQHISQYVLEDVQRIVFRGNAGNDLFDHAENLGSKGGGEPHSSLPPMTLDGGPGDDELNGGPQNDLILGRQDNDTIFGHGGDDIIRGGSGMDTIMGDSGNYAIYGNDTICGDGDNDKLRGNRGNDTLYGGGEPGDELNAGRESGDREFRTACPKSLDGDTKADHGVYRPSDGTWHIINSSDGGRRFRQWGLNGDIPVAGDYDGNGITDLAVFRPGNSHWYILHEDDSVRINGWGNSGDIPVPADYNGDGRTDLAVYRRSDATWWVYDLSTNSPIVWSFQFGRWGDIPVPSDYNGDGRDELAVYRPSDQTWWAYDIGAGWTVAGDIATFSRKPTDIPVPADYDGDGATDLAVWDRYYRPAPWGHDAAFRVRNSSTGYRWERQWGGLVGDSPQPADFDGDGRADLVVFNNSAGNGNWYVLQSSTGSYVTTQWGLGGDLGLHDSTRTAREMVGLPQALASYGTPVVVTRNHRPPTQQQIEAGLSRAIELWQDAGGRIAATLHATIDVRVADLPRGFLGLASDSSIVLDVDADGHGWFVDVTPDDDSEYAESGMAGLIATDEEAQGRVDLLSVLSHEVGHVLGLGDMDPIQHPGNVMAATLRSGLRRLPTAQMASTIGSVQFFVPQPAFELHSRSDTDKKQANPQALISSRASWQTPSQGAHAVRNSTRLLAETHGFSVPAVDFLFALDEHLTTNRLADIDDWTETRLTTQPDRGEITK